MTDLLRKNGRQILVYFIFAVILWFILSFLIIPNIQIVMTTLFPNGEFSTRAFEKITESKRAMDSLKNSFILAICLSVTANIVGVLLVLFTEYFKIKGAKILFLGYGSTLIFGGLILANAYQYIYGESGIITQMLLAVFPNMDPNWFSGFPAVLFTMTFATTSLHLILLRDAFKTIDFQTIEAAKNLGANQFTIIFKIVIPALKPYLLTLTILLFQSGLGAMSAPLILGGDAFQTITPMILNFSNIPSSRDIAALLSIILGVAQVILLLVTLRIERKTRVKSGSKVKTKFIKQKIQNPIVNVIMHIVAWGLFIIYLLPLVILVLYTFMPVKHITSGVIDFSAFTLQNYKDVLMTPEGYHPFLVSLGYSIIASVITVIFIVMIGRFITTKRNKFTECLEMLLYIPWLLPSVLFALGLILTYNLPKFWVGQQILTGTPVIMLIAYIIINIPFTLRIVKSSYAGVDQNLEDASKILGATPWITFKKVIMPVILPTVLAVTALNINNLLQNFDVSLFLYHPLYEPLGVTIYNASNSPTLPNAPALSLVYSLLLMVINGIILYFVYGKGTKMNQIK
ncbi:ABC transporter permease [Staphylococcus sp. 11261D007BR]